MPVEFTDLARFLVPDSDLVALTELLGNLTVKERRALSGPVRRAARLESRVKGNDSALILLALGCVTGVRQVASSLGYLELTDAALPLASRVLRDRDPDWLPNLPKALFDLRLPSDASRLSRRLVRDDLIPAPDLPDYRTGVVHELTSQPGVRDVLQELRADPQILEQELWDMLACEGAGRALWYIDGLLEAGWGVKGRGPLPMKTPERTWRAALAVLSGTGEISRDRLLDETLTACLRDWSARDSAWYPALHDQLSPTLPECAARAGIYLRLLAAGPGPTVSLAQRQLARLIDADYADLPALAQASAVVLSRPDKGTALAQLKLLVRAVAKHPAQTSVIAA